MSRISNVINFKATAAEIAQSPVQTQRAYQPQISPELYQQIQTQKKADSQEKWQKAGIIAQIGLAVAFGIMAIMGIITHSAKKVVDKANVAMLKAQKEYFQSMTRKPENLQKLIDEFVDLSKNPKIVSKEDRSINKAFRDFITEVKVSLNTPKGIKELVGDEATQNMIILSGGSGYGKTYNADVLFKELGAKRIKRQYSNFGSKYVSESATNVTGFFNEIEKILKEKPDQKFGICIDEADSLFTELKNIRPEDNHLKEIRSAVLNGLDQIRKYDNVYIVATTNADLAAGGIDEAILRRFAHNHKVEKPTVEALKASLKTHLQSNKRVVNEGYDFFKAQEKEIQAFLTRLNSEGAGHGDIENIVRSANTKFKAAVTDEGVKIGALRQLENGSYEIVDQAKYDQLLKDVKFDIKYLIEAREGMGLLAAQVKHTR